MNGVLKMSEYSKVANISDPELYKKDE
jgi:hypothetical protein